MLQFIVNFDFLFLISLYILINKCRKEGIVLYYYSFNYY